MQLRNCNQLFNKLYSASTTMYQHLLFNQSFINNQWLSAATTFDVVNPATQQVITSVTNADAHLTVNAVEAAHTAFQTWQHTTVQQRSTILLQWHQLIINNATALAALLTAEQGKPIHEALGEVQYGASFISWFANEAFRTNGITMPTVAAQKQLLTLKAPVGVVAAITPWNFPIAMVTRKLAPALAAGCTVVLKPAEDTPLCALALAHLAAEAGLPAGVLNVVTTAQPQTVGEVLATHPLVQKITFTGSTATGRWLMEKAATTVKRLSLELGGNAPLIVTNNADIPTAVRGTLQSKYRNAGQTCVCANRIYVQRGVYNAFLAAYTKEVQAMKVGDGAHKGTQIGPLINEKALQKVLHLINDATQKGAQVVCGGKRLTANTLLLQPTILTQCNTTMQLHQDEIFGPVTAIYVYDTEAEVIAMANDTIYGLAAYLFTDNIHEAWRITKALQYGIVGVNEGLISHAEAPFGGIKQSGYGKEGGAEGISDYMYTKYVCMGINDIIPNASL
ncbi:MAG: NAD-dependent succinate-semialdehyde dehydrogenase [Chitinophagaceae bacterium]